MKVELRSPIPTTGRRALRGGPFHMCRTRAVRLARPLLFVARQAAGARDTETLDGEREGQEVRHRVKG